MAVKTWQERIEKWLTSGRTTVIYPHHREAAMQEEIQELRNALDEATEDISLLLQKIENNKDKKQ